MRTLPLALWLVACASDVDLGEPSSPSSDWGLPGEVLPPPLTLTLTTAAAFEGKTTSIVTVSGASPGDSVRLLLSGNVGGPALCPPMLAPGCLDIADPAQVIDTVTADATGTADFSIWISDPPAVPAIQLQAVVAGGGTVDTSSAPVVPVYAAGQDDDGDGLSSADEANDTLTNPLVADSDGGGTGDGVEVLVHGTDPLAAGDDLPPDGDLDGDGLGDEDELLVYGTSALEVDTDGDGVFDGAEVLNTGTDPLFYDSHCMGWPERSVTDTAEHVKSVQVVDMDGDVDLDVVTISGIDDEVAVYENLGAGVFGPEIVLDDIAEPQLLMVGDVDVDGDVDVIATYPGPDEVVWYENLGGGVYSGQQLIGLVGTLLWAHTMDVDADGDVDVVVQDYNYFYAGGMVWFENLGGGAFSAVQTLRPYPQNMFGALWSMVGDFDGDGDDDLLSSADGEMGWQENLGGGAFGAPHSIGSDVTTSEAHVTDVDGDGDDDLLVARPEGNTVVLYESDGSELLPGRVLVTSARDPIDILAVDLDGDGDRDLVVSTGVGGSFPFGARDVSWFENLGGEQYGPERLFIAGATTGGSAIVDEPGHFWAVDFDEDGDEDVLMGMGGEDHVAWYENLRAGYDPDNDGLSTGAEDCISATDPLAADSDGGGTDDGIEVNSLGNPNDPADD